jgi:hypothetical protein
MLREASQVVERWMQSHCLGDIFANPGPVTTVAAPGSHAGADCDHECLVKVALQAEYAGMALLAPDLDCEKRFIYSEAWGPPMFDDAACVGGATRIDLDVLVLLIELAHAAAAE